MDFSTCLPPMVSARVRPWLAFQTLYPVPASLPIYPLKARRSLKGQGFTSGGSGIFSSPIQQFILRSGPFASSRTSKNGIPCNRDVSATILLACTSMPNRCLIPQVRAHLHRHGLQHPIVRYHDHANFFVFHCIQAVNLIGISSDVAYLSANFCFISIRDKLWIKLFVSRLERWVGDEYISLLLY